jgi:hypothetical protein
MMTEQLIRTALGDLVALTLGGNWELAFEKYYHEDLEKTDLDGHSFKGKTINLENGRAFSAKISNVREFSFGGSFIKGDRSMLIWSLDFDVAGTPFKITEVAIQDWQEGKIIRERFFG